MGRVGCEVVIRDVQIEAVGALDTSLDQAMCRIPRAQPRAMCAVEVDTDIWSCFQSIHCVVNQRKAVVGRELPGATGSAAAAGVSGLVYVPIGVIVLMHHTPTVASVSYALVAGVMSSAVPFLLDLLTLRRVPAQFFGVFMSVNPVLAALVGLVVLGQHLVAIDWLAIGVIVSANAVAVSFGGRRTAEPEVDSKDAPDHSLVPVWTCEVVHGAQDVLVTPPFGNVSADGQRGASRATQ